MADFKVDYRLEVLNEDLPAFPRNIQERILRAVEQRLETAPDRYGSRLEKSLIGLWKIRVGDYRVIYELKGRHVVIWAVGHRKTAYGEVARRWVRLGR